MAGISPTHVSTLPTIMMNSQEFGVMARSIYNIFQRYSTNPIQSGSYFDNYLPRQLHSFYHKYGSPIQGLAWISTLRTANGWRIRGT